MLQMDQKTKEAAYLLYYFSHISVPHLWGLFGIINLHIHRFHTRWYLILLLITEQRWHLRDAFFFLPREEKITSTMFKKLCLNSMVIYKASQNQSIQACVKYNVGRADRTVTVASIWKTLTNRIPPDLRPQHFRLCLLLLGISLFSSYSSPEGQHSVVATPNLCSLHSATATSQPTVPFSLLAIP